MPPIPPAGRQFGAPARIVFACALTALVALSVAAAPASAGVVAFQSDRCTSAADVQARQIPSPFPGPVPTCRSAIWTVRDDGSDLRQITDGGAPLTSGDFAPSWTPDGVRVVFARTLGGSAQGGARIFVTGSRGGAVAQLTPTTVPSGQFHSDEGPVVSPDGRTIVFSSDRPFPGRPAGGRFDNDIYAMNLDGSNLRVIVSGPTNDINPSFSPDGRRLLFARHDRLFTNPRVVSVDAATGGAAHQHTVTGLPTFGGAAFSPDGAYIALAIQSRLFTMGADGRGLQARVATPSSSPTWVGDGASIIYAGPLSESPTERATTLFRVPLAGAPARGTALLTPYARDDEPAWRPDRPLEVLRPIIDRVPPVASLVDAVTNALPEPITAALTRLEQRQRPVARTLRPRSARLNVRRMRDLTYVAADVGGLRRVELTLERRLPGGVCRPLRSSGRLGEPRACGKPPWLRPRDAATWRRWMGRLGKGTYRVRVRGIDRRGRTTPRPTPVTVRYR